MPAEGCAVDNSKALSLTDVLLMEELWQWRNESLAALRGMTVPSEVAAGCCTILGEAYKDHMS